MDEERTEIPVPPEKIELKDDSLRSSTRRASTSNSREKIIPHHLRASTGSCHDFCKYGWKHAFEAKGKHPILEGISATSDEGKNVIQDITLATKKKKQVIKPKPSLESNFQVPDASTIIKRETKVVMQEDFPSFKKIDASKQSVSLPKSKKKQLIKPQPSVDPEINVSDRAKMKQGASLISMKTVNGKDEIGMNLRPVAVKSTSSFFRYSDDPTGGRNSGMKIVTNTGNSKTGQRKEFASPRLTRSLKPSLSSVASLKSRNNEALKAVSPPKKQNKIRRSEPTLQHEEEVIEKVLYMIESKPDNKRLGPIGNASNSRLASLSLSSLSPESSSAQSYPSLPCPEKEENILSHSEFCEEKDLASERKKTQKTNKIESVKQEYKQRSRRSATNDSASQHNKNEKKNQVKPPKQAQKLRPTKRAEMVKPEDKDLSSKLNFRRGKVVNVQSENNSPRRLKFRQGRTMGDNQNGKGDIRRSFKQRKVVAVEIGITKAESEKVTLRHQDVNGKKDAQGLYNNVIEETASKLVETRKSKVKALVGAFETVISLQEGKASIAITT